MIVLKWNIIQNVIFDRFFVGGTAKFFGVEVETLASSEQCWWERRRRLAIKRFGGVKDEYLDGGGNAYNSQVCKKVHARTRTYRDQLKGGP